MTGEYTSQVTPSRPPRGGSVNGSVSRDTNVAFPLGRRFAPCPLNLFVSSLRRRIRELV